MASFYYVPMSFNCLGVSLLIAHLNVDAESKIVDIMNGACRTPEFLAMNPMHCIPTYKAADGATMWEGNVIVRYIAQSQGSSLLPSDATAALYVDQALYFRTLQLYTASVPLVYPIMGFAAPLDEAAKEKALASFAEVLDILFSRFIKGDEFAAGSALTIADFQIYPVLKAVELTKVSPDARITAYIAKFEAAVPSCEGVMAGLAGYIASKM